MVGEDGIEGRIGLWPMHGHDVKFTDFSINNHLLGSEPYRFIILCGLFII